MVKVGWDDCNNNDDGGGGGDTRETMVSEGKKKVMVMVHGW
jgi:hypothetical protein